MSELHDKVRQAQRRLWLNRWLSKLGWSLTGAAAAFVAFVVFERIVLALVEEGYVLWRVAGGLAAAGLLVSVVWTFITRDSLAVAAARLDEAAHLKERLSTALHFANSADPFAKAAVADAHHVSQLVTPRTYLPVRLPQSAPYAGGSFVLALLFFWLFPVVDLSGKQEMRQEEQLRQQEVKRVEAQVKPVVDKLREIQKKHPELQKQAEQADPLNLANLDAPADLKKNALKEVNAAAAKLEEKKSQGAIAEMQEFKQMLRRLAAEPPSASSVSMLSKSLARGDFKSAQAALNSIRDQLSNVPESSEDKAKAEALRSDLKKLADQVGKIAESDNKLKDQMRQMNLSQEDINKLMENVSQNKMDELASKLAEKGLTNEQIDKLMKHAAKSAAAKKAAGKLAQNLAKAAQKQPGQQNQQGQDGQQGEQGQADQGFSEAGEQLSEMESLEQELAELSTALSDLQGCKDGLCEGLGSGFGEGGDPDMRGGGMGRLGQGRGGIAPEQETPVGFTPERTRVHTASGVIIDQRFVEGDQFKGEVQDEFVEAVLGAREDLTEVTRKKIQPRHIKLRQADYFKRVESDFPKDKLEAARQKLEPAEEVEQN